MSVEETNICADCGKYIQGNKGSLTQWIGLGDSCKCDQKDVGTSVHVNVQQKKKGKKCKRCLKPLRAKQSMTQWLIKTETCKCPAESETQISTDYTQLAMSKRSLNRLPRKEENKSLAVFLCIGVLLFALMSGYAILDILGVSHSWRLLGGRLKGHERKLTFGVEGLEQSVQDLPSTREGWNKREFQRANQAYIKDSTISDDDLERLSSNENLLRVYLKNCDGFTANGVKAFQKLPGLAMLSFDSSKIDADILKSLGDVKVDRIDLSNTAIGNADWSVLLKNPYLETLYVYGVPVSDANRGLFEQNGFRTSPDFFVRPKK